MSNSFVGTNSLGSVYAGISSTGTTLATATVIPPSITYVQVSTCPVSSTPSGISLPAIVQSGQSIIVRNDGLGLCLVYGATVSVQINGLAAGSGWYVAANGGICEFVASGNNQWFVIFDVGLKTLPIASTAVALTLTAAHNGMIFGFPAMAGAFTATIPPPSSGYNFKALVTASPIANIVTFTGGGASSLRGTCQIDVAGATACLCTSIAAAGQATIRFTATAIAGDLLEFTSTDLLYNIKGFGQAAISFSVG